MAIKRLMGATIWSENLQNLLPFYKDRIGLSVSFESPEFVVLGKEDEPTLALGTHSEVRGKASDPYRHFVALESDDLEGDVGRLKQAGVEFIEDPTDYGGLRIATLKDPEGNVVQLMQPTS
jgi:glyoxylase I family protein